jgi:hypothetical protein
MSIGAVESISVSSGRDQIVAIGVRGGDTLVMDISAHGEGAAEFATRLSALASKRTGVTVPVRVAANLTVRMHGRERRIVFRDATHPSRDMRLVAKAEKDDTVTVFLPPESGP